MAKLKKASLFSAVGSFFFPKKIEVEVRTETLANGNVRITPVFTVDGEEISGERLKPLKSQMLEGYNVSLDEQRLDVLRFTQGKATTLTKRKAGEYLSNLSRTSVPIRSKDGATSTRVDTAKANLKLELRDDDSLTVRSELTTNSGVVIQKPPQLNELMRDEGWISAGDDLLKVETTGTPLDRVLVPEGGNGTLLGNDVPRFLSLLERNSARVGEVEKNDKLQKTSIITESQTCVKVSGDGDSITVAPSMVFKSKQGAKYEKNADEIGKFDSHKGGYSRVTDGWLEVKPESISDFNRCQRHLNEELDSLENIRGASIPDALQVLSDLARHGSTPWAVYFSREVADSHRLIDEKADVQFRLNVVDRDGKSLLELDPIYNHDRFSVTHGELMEAAAQEANWIRRKDAWIKIDKRLQGKVAERAKAMGLESAETGYAFPASQREQVIEQFSLLGSIEHSKAYADFLLKLADFEKIEETALPANLKAEIKLRPYQQHGFNWLAFLHRFGLNGILADDMGLGKTLQTLSVIQRANQLSKSNFPSLIICPTSVIRNWSNEVQKFFNDCEVIVYANSNRERRIRHLKLSAFYSGPKTNTIVIASYDVARIDFQTLGEISWLYVVVDEGHNIKNPDAKRTKAIKMINGQHKLALTGTPIQNNLEELWALFDFVMPSFLGSRSNFRDTYGRDGRVNWDAVRGGAVPLGDRIHPFILRRLKQNVAKDLPSKQVIELSIELTAKQVLLYKKVLETPEYQKMVEEVNEKGVNRCYDAIFKVLTNLRHICNHPGLLTNEPVESVRYEDSAKLDATKELMEEIIEGEHRALLFSQSTKMLDIIEHFFRQWKFSFLRLDGSVAGSVRQGLVDEFNSNESINCFLISTKAGGTGLNLVGADTVIFFDHDWNPANDRQAQDRAYRIGQTKPVTVYKLISKGTIEDKIIARQFAKQSLADEIIGADEQGFKDLTKEELLSLFTIDENPD